MSDCTVRGRVNLGMLGSTSVQARFIGLSGSNEVELETLPQRSDVNVAFTFTAGKNQYVPPDTSMLRVAAERKLTPPVMSRLSGVLLPHFAVP
jgi:hypothetical protein